MFEIRCIVTVIFAIFCYQIYTNCGGDALAGNAVKIKRQEDYLGKEKEEIVEFKKFYTNDRMLYLEQEKNHETLVKNIDNYVKRYISLFLLTANLLDHKVKDLNEMISVDLEILVTGKDLEFLQKYLREEYKKSNPLRNLSMLDEIMSRIARHKKRSFMEHSVRSLKALLSNFIYVMLSSPTFYHYLPYLLIIIGAFIIGCYFSVKSTYLHASIILNSMIFWDGILFYKKRLKEVDLELYVDSMRLREVPRECFPENIKWYNSLINLFTEDKCLKFHQLLNKKVEEEVSFLQCILDTYAFYYVRMPMKILAACSKDYSKEMASTLPWPFNLVAGLAAFPIFTVILLFFVLVLCRKRIKLSFFGAAVEVGNESTAFETKNKIEVSQDKPNAIREGRKLKPWTKSRFQKKPSNVKMNLWSKLLREHRKSIGECSKEEESDSPQKME